MHVLIELFLCFNFLVMTYEYKCVLSLVTSKEHLVWVVVKDDIHTFHKYDLELPYMMALCVDTYERFMSLMCEYYLMM